MKNIVLMLLFFTVMPGCITRDPGFHRRESKVDAEEKQFTKRFEKQFEEQTKAERRRELREKIERRRRKLEPAGIYVGFGVGRSEVPHICDLSTSSCDDRGQGMKVFSGVELSPHFNLELSYVDLGKFGVGSVSDETDGFSLSGIGLIPLQGDIFFLTAKAGLFRWETRSSEGSTSVSLNGIDLIYGVGSIVKFADQFGLRAEWEKYTAPSFGFDAELLSISGMFFF